MASRFMTAAAESYRTLGMRKDARPLDYSLVGWNEAVPAVALLAVSQGVMIAGSLGNLLMEYLPLAFAIGVVTLVTFAVPFAVVIAWAYLSKQLDRLPLLVMFVAIVLFAVQVLNMLLSYLGLQTFFALVAGTAVFVGRSIRTVLGASMPMAILAGVLVGLGMATAGLLIFVLPIGQATTSLT
jgi:Na+-translocating ferredoxin:NAD+ oxidoreductase RnfE subunit